MQNVTRNFSDSVLSKLKGLKFQHHLRSNYIFSFSNLLLTNPLTVCFATSFQPLNMKLHEINGL